MMKTLQDSHIFISLLIETIGLLKDHLFSMYAKFSEKLLFLTPR